MSLRKYLTVTAFSAASLFGGDARGTSVGGEIELKTPTEDFLLPTTAEDLDREAEAIPTSQDYRPSTEDRLDGLSTRIDNLERLQEMHNVAGGVVDCLFGVAIGGLIAYNLVSRKKTSNRSSC